ncbi:MoxR family ATPase [Desulfobacula sp.]|uniref:AAA family ATPase n=1 Tax=Desulfobacula sp. TaxID=2593537 RepID=UPI002624235F|nr:MoxR family ATPase [Desulfobacula sp.]
MDFNICFKIIDNISRVIVGKRDAIELMLVALLADGHALLEDVPGVGKTLLARCLAASIGGSYKRIQFTPDLLPSDITGFNIYLPNEGRFRFQQGPVMANILLADEINRTVPRTQSSLLESMEERQVTVDGKTFQLPAPFFVIATQNPVELEGTFPLPEAQLDRFLLKIDIGYPDKKEEMEILKRFQTHDPFSSLTPVATPEDLFRLQQERKKIIVSTPVRDYITTIVQATRHHPMIKFGASPRGSMALMRSAQALAALDGREFTLPDDVKRLTLPVLAHRLILNENERLRGGKPEQVLTDILNQTPIPDGTHG